MTTIFDMDLGKIEGYSIVWRLENHLRAFSNFKIRVQWKFSRQIDQISRDHQRKKFSVKIQNGWLHFDKIREPLFVTIFQEPENEMYVFPLHKLSLPFLQKMHDIVTKKLNDIRCLNETYQFELQCGVLAKNATGQKFYHDYRDDHRPVDLIEYDDAQGNLRVLRYANLFNARKGCDPQFSLNNAPELTMQHIEVTMTYGEKDRQTFVVLDYKTMKKLYHLHLKQNNLQAMYHRITTAIAAMFEITQMTELLKNTTRLHQKIMYAMNGQMWIWQPKYDQSMYGRSWRNDDFSCRAYECKDFGVDCLLFKD